MEGQCTLASFRDDGLQLLRRSFVPHRTHRRYLVVVHLQSSVILDGVLRICGFATDLAFSPLRCFGFRCFD